MECLCEKGAANRSQASRRPAVARGYGIDDTTKILPGYTGPARRHNSRCSTLWVSTTT